MSQYFGASWAGVFGVVAYLQTQSIVAGVGWGAVGFVLGHSVDPHTKWSITELRASGEE